MEHAVIVAADGVAVPIPGQRVEHDHTEEAVDVEHGKERIEALFL